MTLSNMVELDNKRTSYSFNGQEGIFRVEGSCTYNEERLIDANGTFFAVSNESGEENQNVTAGSFNYSAYDPDNSNYSFNFRKEFEDSFFGAVTAVVANLKDAR